MNKKHDTITTRIDDDRAIGYIDDVIVARGMVEGQTQYGLLQLVKQHIRNTREYIMRINSDR